MWFLTESHEWPLICYTSATTSPEAPKTSSGRHSACLIPLKHKDSVMGPSQGMPETLAALTCSMLSRGAPRSSLLAASEAMDAARPREASGGCTKYHRPCTHAQASLCRGNCSTGRVKVTTLRMLALRTGTEVLMSVSLTACIPSCPQRVSLSA